MRVTVEALFGMFCCVAYLGIAQAFGEEYPFSPLTMFSGKGNTSGRVVVRAHDGLHEVTDFVDWSCDGPVDFTNTTQPACAYIGAHEERDSLATDYVRSHSRKTSSGEPVVIGRRWFRTDHPRGPIVQGFCVLARCRATRR